MTGTDVFYGLGLLIVFLASPKDLNQVPHLSWISEMMLTLSKMYTNKQQWKAKVLHMVMNKNSKHCCECDETLKRAMLQNKKPNLLTVSNPYSVILLKGR